MNAGIKPQKKSIYETCPKCMSKIYCEPHICTQCPSIKKCPTSSSTTENGNQKQKYPSFAEHQNKIDNEIQIYDPEFEAMYGEFLRFNPPLIVYRRKKTLQKPENTKPTLNKQFKRR